jgi:hypothetical protein
VEGIIHFENDIEELQQWDHQVIILAFLLISTTGLTWQFLDQCGRLVEMCI